MKRTFIQMIDFHNKQIFVFSISIYVSSSRQISENSMIIPDSLTGFTVLVICRFFRSGFRLYFLPCYGLDFASSITDVEKHILSVMRRTLFLPPQELQRRDQDSTCMSVVCKLPFYSMHFFIDNHLMFIQL